jgi:predicted  nucleic acid-binding Zn-ribbon protein
MQDINSALYPNDITIDTLNEVLQWHRNIFGDARMDDDGDGDGGDGDGDKGGDGAGAGAGGNNEESADDKLTKAELAKALQKTRKEAASYRTKLRDAEDKLSKAKTPEEYETAVEELRSTNSKLEHSLLVAKVATKYGLPEDLASRLSGDDQKALEEDAKSLQKYAKKSAETTGKGGLSPDDEKDPLAGLGPRELAKKYGSRRY